MSKARLTVECSNGCFEAELTGPSLEHIYSIAVKERTNDPCPICGGLVLKEEVEGEE